VGQQTVEFSDVAGWAKAGNQAVTINDGQKTTASGTYTPTQQTGSLTVTINPQGAINAGAKWRRAGTDTWQNSGATETGIPVSQYTVEFSDVTAWTKPGNQAVTISNGQTTTATGTYTQQTGSLTVTIGPQGAVDAGAKWRRSGTDTWRDSGTTESGISVGQYTVEFSDIEGWTKPGNQAVTISSGQTATATGTFDIHPVYPVEGTIGTEFTITGSDFGTKKGKVLIQDVAATVLQWMDGLIECRLTKPIVPGLYDVTIQPKGRSPILFDNGFTVKAPEIDSVAPTSGSAGDEVTIHGFFFGTKKGKVTLGGKNCKVLNWTTDPVTGEGEIGFVVPKGLALGTYDITVTNSVGSDTGPDMFTIQ
jgi:hypothetical protein